MEPSDFLFRSLIRPSNWNLLRKQTGKCFIMKQNAFGNLRRKWPMEAGKKELFRIRRPSKTVPAATGLLFAMTANMKPILAVFQKTLLILRTIFRFIWSVIWQHLIPSRSAKGVPEAQNEKFRRCLLLRRALTPSESSLASAKFCAITMNMRDKFIGFSEASCALITQLLSEVICASTHSLAFGSFIATEILAKNGRPQLQLPQKFSMAFGIAINRRRRSTAKTFTSPEANSVRRCWRQLSTHIPPFYQGLFPSSCNDCTK